LRPRLGSRDRIGNGNAGFHGGTNWPDCDASRAEEHRETGYRNALHLLIVGKKKAPD